MYVDINDVINSIQSKIDDDKVMNKDLPHDSKERFYYDGKQNAMAQFRDFLKTKYL